MKTPLTFSLEDLKSFPTTDIGSADFMDSKETRYTVSHVKGILMKNLFDKVGFTAENRKALNRFYLVCEAPDAFKVVFSYNEIFSPMACTNYYLVTEYDGKSIAEMNDRILIVSCDGSHKAHKFIKGLSAIVVNEVQ